MGCRDAVLPNPLLKNCAVNCFMFDKNTKQPHNGKLRFYRAFALHLESRQKEEETF